MRTIVGTGVAIGVAVAIIGLDSNANAQPYGGYGMMGGYGPGYGMMGGYGPGYGMMGGYGPGCYGPAMMYGGCDYGPGYMMGYGPGYGPRIGYGPAYGQRNLNLSTDDVRNYFARWIAAQGNSHLKVGDVKEQGPDTIVADIVTQDNSLVQEFVINRHTGFYHPEQASATNQTNPTNPTKPTTQPNQK
jgi:hypothetical protein